MRETRENDQPSSVHLAKIDRPHPSRRSLEPGERRGWCFVGELPFERL